MQAAQRRLRAVSPSGDTAFAFGRRARYHLSDFVKLRPLCGAENLSRQTAHWERAASEEMMRRAFESLFVCTFGCLCTLGRRAFRSADASQTLRLDLVAGGEEIRRIVAGLHRLRRKLGVPGAGRRALSADGAVAAGPRLSLRADRHRRLGAGRHRRLVPRPLCL